MQVLKVDRRQVLAHRVVAQGLDRPGRDLGSLAVLDLGVQDTARDGALLGLSARLGHAVQTLPPELARVWSVRGAPHLHRRADLPELVAALWPLDDADATARIRSSAIRDGAKLGLEAFRVTADALRAVVTRPLSRGEVSGAVSARVPESLTFWCDPCQAQHISALVLQQAALAAGVELLKDGRSMRPAPLPDRFPLPSTASDTEAVLRRYLALLGPATPGDTAAYLGTTRRPLQPAWPADLVEVDVDGVRTWLPETAVEALRGAPAPRLTRLLPPADPWLQARDRELVLPDPARRKAVWRAISAPGVVLVDGEVAGTWTARRGKGDVLELTVSPFAPLPTPIVRGLAAEATLVAAVRGAPDVRVHTD